MLQNKHHNIMTKYYQDDLILIQSEENTLHKNHYLNIYLKPLKPFMICNLKLPFFFKENG